MSAQRKAIRHAMRDMLLGATDAGQRVYTNRGVRLDESLFPAIVIMNAGESIEEHAIAPLIYKREAEISVEVHVQPGSTADDLLDDLAEQVEAVFWPDETLGGTTEELRLLRVSETAVEGEARQDIAALALVYRATYFSEQPEAQGLNDLKTVHVEHETGQGDNEVSEAEDLITLPTD